MRRNNGLSGVYVFRNVEPWSPSSFLHSLPVVYIHRDEGLLHALPIAGCSYWQCDFEMSTRLFFFARMSSTFPLGCLMDSSAWWHCFSWFIVHENDPLARARSLISSQKSCPRRVIIYSHFKATWLVDL